MAAALATGARVIVGAGGGKVLDAARAIAAETMQRVRDFSFAQGLFGQGAASADAVGMEFPGGKTLGDKNAITLRFDPTFMQLATDGKL